MKGPDQSCSICGSDEKHEFSDNQQFKCKDCGAKQEWRQICCTCNECGAEMKQVGPMVP